MLRHRLTIVIVIAGTSNDEMFVKPGAVGAGKPRLTGPTIATLCLSCNFAR